MPSYRLHNADCSISTQYLDVSHESQLPMPGDGFMWSEVPSPASDWTVAIDHEGAIIAVPYEDDADYIMSLTRAKVWEEAKAYRDRRIDGGAMTPQGRVDSDEGSRVKISGAVQMTLLAQIADAPLAPPINWTMQDSSVVEHDAAQLIAMGVAVGQHTNRCHQVCSAIKVAIFAANDLAALRAIDITAGYDPK